MTHLAPRITVVTPTWNRAHLLPRLFESLARQTKKEFEWLVVDDNSTDDTANVIKEFSQNSPLKIRYVRNEKNRGKCASLNRAFASAAPDFWLVVDSDEELHSTAIEIAQGAISKYVHDPRVGAIMFRYETVDARLIGPTLPENEVVLSRAASDHKFGKFDGAVGYFARTTKHHRYPEFLNETYVGPTVLQLMMAPQLHLVFTNSVIATAEYQSDGLTAAGRQLRLKNPRGMMIYADLQSRQAPTLRLRFKNRVMYHAYSHIAGQHTTFSARALREPTLIFGVGLAAVWRYRHGATIQETAS